MRRPQEITDEVENLPGIQRRRHLSGSVSSLGSRMSGSSGTRQSVSDEDMQSDASADNQSISQSVISRVSVTAITI